MKKTLLIGAAILMAGPAVAKYDNSFANRTPIHSNVLTVNYIKAVSVHTENTWIGTKVFKVDNSCFEVKQDLNVVDKPVSFSNVINAAEIPESFRVSELNTDTKAVSCDMYEVDAVKVIQ